MMTNSTFYLYVNITFKVKTYLDEFPQNTWSRLGFRLTLLKRNEIYSIKIPVVTPPTTFNWVSYTNMADQGIEVLIKEDSDLGLATQKNLQFRVYASN